MSAMVDVSRTDHEDGDFAPKKRGHRHHLSPCEKAHKGAVISKPSLFFFSRQQRDHCFVLSWALLRPKGRRRGFTLHGLIIITTYPRPFQKHTQLHNWSVHGRIQAALGFCSQFAPMFTLSRNLVRLWDVLTKRKICIFTTFV